MRRGYLLAIVLVLSSCLQESSPDAVDTNSRECNVACNSDAACHAECGRTYSCDTKVGWNGSCTNTVQPLQHPRGDVSVMTVTEVSPTEERALQGLQALFSSDPFTGAPLTIKYCGGWTCNYSTTWLCSTFCGTINSTCMFGGDSGTGKCMAWFAETP